MAARIFDNFSAIVLLCENGWPTQAGIVLRSVFELALSAKYISSGDRAVLAERWAEYTNVYDYKWLYDYATSSSQVENNERLETGLRELKERFDRFKSSYNNTKSWHGRDMCSLSRSLDMHGYYLLIYRRYSEAAHATSVSLGEGIVLMNEKNGRPLTRVRYGPRWDEETEDIMEYALKLVFDFFRIWAEEFELVDKLKSDFRSLASRYVELS